MRGGTKSKESTQRGAFDANETLTRSLHKQQEAAGSAANYPRSKSSLAEQRRYATTQKNRDLDLGKTASIVFPHVDISASQLAPPKASQGKAPPRIGSQQGVLQSSDFATGQRATPQLFGRFKMSQPTISSRNEKLTGRGVQSLGAVQVNRLVARNEKE